MRQLLEQITIPRAVGTAGNQKVTALVKERLEQNGYEVTNLPFQCMVWEDGESWIEWDSRKQSVSVSPYSKAFDGEGTAQAVSSVEALADLSCEESIVFLTGELSAESLQPKDYPFYYPDEHKQIIDLLEAKRPLAVIAVTGKDMMSGMEPFPMFDDGNFEIPSGYLSINDFEAIRELVIGNRVYLHLDSRCTKVQSGQLYGEKKAQNPKGKIVIGGHMDTKNHTAGALDNAAGIAALLQTAEKVAAGNYDIGIIPFNSEEYFGGDGELAYLRKVQADGDNIVLFINIDSVGHIGSKAAVSLYNIPEEMTELITGMLAEREDVVIGEPWYAGDHAAFAFRGVPCIAVTSSDIFSGGLNDTHTMRDTVDTVDVKLLSATASFLADVVGKMK